VGGLLFWFPLGLWVLGAKTVSEYGNESFDTGKVKLQKLQIRISYVSVMEIFIRPSSKYQMTGILYWMQVVV